MAGDLTVHQDRAQALFEAGKYQDALNEYTVLRTLRAAREGTQSVMYLSNLHSSIYCLRHLGQWSQAAALASELSTTRDRILGESDPSSIDAKRWWAWTSAEAGDFQNASNLQVQLANTFYTIGDVKQAERAVGAAVLYQSKAGATTPEAATNAVESTAAVSENGSRIRGFLKKIAPEMFIAGVTATFEGVVGGIFE